MASKTLVVLLCLFIIPIQLKSQTNELSKLETLGMQAEKAQAAAEEETNLNDTIKLISEITKTETKCETEAYALKNSNRFITTFSAEHLPCRVYDLEYPGLFQKASKIPIVDLPAQEISKAAILNLAQGNVSKSLAQFEINSARLETSQSDILSNALIKNGITRQALQNGISAEKFISSQNLEWDKNSKNLIKLLKESSPSELDFSLEHLDSPTNFLKKIVVNQDSTSSRIRVQWSEENQKRYHQKILLDFNRPYKLLWEISYMKVIRYIATQAIVLVPEPLTANLIRIAVQDLFDIININYLEQYYHLEAVLRMNLGNTSPTAISREVLNRSLNLLYADKNKTLFKFVVQGLSKGYSLKKWELAAADTRLQSEMAWSKTFSKHYLTLRQKPGCELKLLYNFFATCSSGGRPSNLFALNTSEQFSFLNFGPKKIYNYEKPWQVTALKALAWATSAAVRAGNLFGAYAPNNLLSVNAGIAGALKGYARDGSREQAFLHQALVVYDQNRTSQNSDSHLELIQRGWLNAQTLNPMNIFNWHQSVDMSSQLNSEVNGLMNR